MHTDRRLGRTAVDRLRSTAVVTAVIATTTLGAVAVVPASAGYAAPAQTQAVPLVVGVQPGTPPAAPADRLEARTDVDVTATEPVVGAGAVTVDVPRDDVSEAITALRADPTVAYVELDRPAAVVDALPTGVVGAAPDGTASAVTTDDPDRGDQWGLDRAEVPTAWEQTVGSPDVTVAVVDTGVDAVPDLAGALLPGYDFVNDDNDASDDEGHGTATAGVLTARGDNGVATAGVCWTCSVLPVKVLDANGSGWYSDIAAGIVWAADHDADIINLSLGGPYDSRVLRDAVAHATAAGSLVVAAAGNAGSTSAFYPAALPQALAVGASTITDARYSWSSYGPTWVDVAAPGCNPAQGRDGVVSDFCGTSSAAPFASGVAALVLAATPGAGVEQLRSALTSTAVPIAGGWVAAGRLDAAAAVGAGAGSPTVTVTTPAPGAYLRGTVTVTPTVSDDIGATRVEALLDGVPAAEATADPWTLDVDTTVRGGGRTTLTVIAYDGDGNSASAHVPVTIDNDAPYAWLLTPRADARVRGATVVVATAAIDRGGVRQVQLRANGQLVHTDTRAPWVAKWRPGSVSGPVALTVSVEDRAGNVRTLSRSVVVDNVRPVVGFRRAPGKSTRVGGTLAVEATAGDRYGVKQVDLLINNRVVRTDRSSRYTFRAPTARYGRQFTVQLRTQDLAGNVSYSPRRTWRN